MIARCILIASLACSSIAWAEYRLFDPQGTVSTVPNDLVLSMPTVDVIDVPLVVPADSLFDLVNQTLDPQATDIIRQEPPLDATNVQRQALVAQKTRDLQAMIRPLVGQTYNVTFTVIDVINRPPPEKPADPGAGAPPEIHAAFQKQMTIYQAEADIHRQAPYLAIGELRLPHQRFKKDGQANLTPEQRKEIARINADFNARKRAVDEKYKEMRRNKQSFKPTDASKERVELEKARKAAIAAVARATPVSPPTHMVYCLGNQALLKWRRGDVQTLDAVIQKAGLFITNPNAGQMATASIGGSTAVQLADENMDRASVSCEFTLVGIDPTQARQGFASVSPADTAPAPLQFGDAMRIGQVGTIPLESTIVQIVDQASLIADVGSGSIVVIRNFPTFGRVDGQTLQTELEFAVTSTLRRGSSTGA